MLMLTRISGVWGWQRWVERSLEQCSSAMGLSFEVCCFDIEYWAEALYGSEFKSGNFGDKNVQADRPTPTFGSLAFPMEVVLLV